MAKMSIRDLVRKNKAKLKDLAVETVKETSELAVTRTPVDTGQLRGSWFASIGDLSPSGGTPVRLEPGGGPAPSTPDPSTLSRISAVAEGLSIGDVVYVANYADYALDIERGKSNQAPVGFVGVTVNDSNVIIEDIAARLKRK